ncbi:MAG: zinc ribbon domain-containing protein [Candidatus Hodarchaeota archaeon]
MVLAAIETNFTCGCGTPMIVMALDPAPNDKVDTLLTCPRHQLGQHIILDHSALDLWAPVVADHLYRCAICGRELLPGTKTSSSEVTTTFTLNCPIHGTQNNTRTVWSVLHRRLLSEIQRRRSPQPIPKEAPPPSPVTKEPSSQTLEVVPASTQEAQFCPQCGKKIRGKDNFCFHCGAAID